MTVLITGGAGYIGSHTCLAMLQAGRNIVVLDNFSNSQPESLNRVKQITGIDFPVSDAGDIRDKSGIARPVFLSTKSTVLFILLA
jgi:UDP-glucose 4-epimerase